MMDSPYIEKLISEITTSRSKLPMFFKLKLWFYTMFYHSSFSFSYTVDTLFEPLFWFIDHFAKCLGKIFVGTVIVLISLIVLIAHLLGFPVWWYRSPNFTIVLIIIGYWILVNLVFNFTQAVRISPGLPNDTQVLAKTMNVTICKKCISPKPPRTHHCSICNRCCLCMCHHCPWVNNCIGHFNRRYFYLCMVYIVIGCLYVMVFGLEIGYQQVLLGKNVLPFRKLNSRNNEFDLNKVDEENEVNLFHRLYQLFLVFPIQYLIPKNAVAEGISKDLIPEKLDEEEEEKAELLFGILVTRAELLTMIYFVALLCIGASLALGGLCIWHGKLISKGETSIEYHINKAERLKNSQFKNPYDLGMRRNWKVFLGLDQPNKTFWRHILLPSDHYPTGNGYTWDHLTVLTSKNYDY